MPEILQRKQGQSFYDLCEEKTQMLPEERQFLKEVLQNKKSFLEIGAGYSILWCSQFVQRVVSVEARKPRFEEIESYLKKHGISNVELHLLPPELCAYYDDGREKWNNRDIPEGSDYGFTEEFIGYLEGIERLLDNNHFDVVLVDGYVRKQIIEMLIRKKFDGVILLHNVMPERDYLNRPILALNGVKIINQVKTFGELAVAPYKLEVGGQRYTPGWITTDKPQLDVTNVNDWRKWFKPISIKTIFAEHILEHLSPEETECFFESAYEYLCEGGRIRIAVPDALHPSAWYHKSCKPGGLDLGSDDHKYFFSCKNIYKFFDPAKYDIRLLEWWDEEGFHKAKWQNDDTHGKVMRSSEYYDGRITKSTELQKLLRDSTPEDMRTYYSQYGITYTSLIFELVKKGAELTVLHGHSKSSGKVNISNGPYPVTIKTTDGRILDFPQLPCESSQSYEVPTDIENLVQNVHKWSNPKLLYLASADQWLGFEAYFNKTHTMQCDVFYCVIGGLGGLNILPLLKSVEKIVFYDVNIYAVRISDLQLQLIKHCSSVNEYISLIYQRTFDSSKYNYHNQEDFLNLPIEQEYGQILRRILTPEAHDTYTCFYLPYITLLPSPLYDGPTIHCTHLLPFFESDELADPLVYPLNNTSVNVNIFYVGKGWLSSNKTFLAVRSCLLNSEIEMLVGDIAEVKPVGKFPGIYVSNIYSTHPDYNGYKQFIHLFRWMIGYDDNTDREVQYYSNDTTEGMVEYEKLIGAGNGNAHATCCQAIDSLLDLHKNQFLEVIEPHPTEGMNFGFRFYEGQKRITVEDYLKADVSNEEIIALHILLGAGVSQNVWRNVCRKAVQESKRFVLILEHRKECDDWPEWDVHENNLLSHEKLDQFIYSMDWRWKKYGMPNLKGDITDVRNILYFLDKKETSAVYEPQLPVQQSMRQDVSVAQSTPKPPATQTAAEKTPRETSHKKPCLFLNTYYPAFLNNHYEKNRQLHSESYINQKNSLQRACFGDSDFYSEGLKKVGWDAEDLIINCNPLQQAWALENDFSGEGLEIAIEQIRRKKPEVVYLQNLSVGTADFLSAIRPHTKLIVGQIASPVPDCTDLQGFDIIFSSLPHFVERFRKAGITSYYQPLAFEPRVLEKIPQSSKKYPITFVGGMSPAHGKGQQILEELSELVPIDFWGYGAESLPENSPIRQRHHGESWGPEMFSCLRQSTMTINRHIDVAENNANNMRLFEATGCGAMLITDYKDNLNELFEIGKEVVAYRSPEEAAALIKYYSSYPEEAEKISHAGRQRTLTDHTYAQRMKQTAEILSRHLRYRQEKNRFTAPDMSKISCGFSPIQKSEICESLTTAWQSEDIPAKQRALTQQELEAMYKGTPPTIYQVLADCIKEYVTTNSSIVEIGCSSGYYYEILEYLLNKRIAYTGVDYSEPLISMAKDYYPNAEFFVADGANMPFDDGWFHIAISSCILLHVPNYQEHIAETARVAKDFVVAHRTPICRRRPTQYFKKFAYGVETVELRFNEDEILSEFASNGLKLIKAIEYYSNPQKDSFEVTYLFKKTITHNDIIDNKVKRFGQADYTPSPTKFKNGPVVLVSRDIAFTFPLSYAYLAGYLKEKGEDVRILFKDSDHNELIRQIMELNPVLVGFGSLYPELKETHDIIRLLDKAGRQFPIVIGGQMVSPTPEFAVKVTGADFGVIGEGEIILHQLVTALRQGREPADVKGLVVRQGDEFLSTGPGEFIEDLSKLPPVPYELFPQEKWLPIGRWYAEHCPQPHWKIDDRVINVHGGRGCPYKCNFCYHHSRPRYRPIPLMIAEVAEALERFNGNMLAFSDDLVLANPKRARQLVGAIEALNRHVEYSVSARFDILARIDDDLLYEMKKTGCRTMGLGIESGSDRILKLIGKNCTADTVRSGLSRLKKFGILPTVTIMVGQYTETREDAEASIELMRESIRSNPDIQYAFTITTPFPGSQLYDLIFQKGYLRSHQEFYDIYFSTGREFQQVVNLSEMSSEEVLEIHKRIAEIYMEEKAKACDRKLIKQVNSA